MPAPVSPSWAARVGQGFAQVPGLAWRLLLENLYIVTLAVVYLCSLQDVNVINAIFCTSVRARA